MKELRTLQKFVDLIKSGELTVNLSFRIVTKITKLFKKYALANKTTTKELTELFRKENGEFWRQLNEFIADEYDDDKDQYGDLATQLFKIVKHITGTRKSIEDMQFHEVVEVIQTIVAKIQEEQAENFLQQEDTTLEDTAKQLSIIENENSLPKKEKVRSQKPGVLIGMSLCFGMTLLLFH